jgi:hypothetical protein
MVPGTHCNGMLIKGENARSYYGSDLRLTIRLVCQNGTPDGRLDDIATAHFRHRAPSVSPPSPHRIPSVPPPKPESDLKCAILAQFGVSGTLGSGWEARSRRGVSREDI